MIGTVKSFNRHKSYGFIIGENGNEYFFHSLNLEDRRTIKPGEIVIFKSKVTDKGIRATHIRRVNEEHI